MKATEIVEPGVYTVEVKIRGTVVVEEGEELTALEVAGQAYDHGGSKIVDWEISRRNR